MGHDGVAAHGRVGNLVRIDAMAFGHLVNQPVDGAEHAPAKFLQSLRAARVIDPADHVQAASDLVVVVAASRDDLGHRQVDQLHRDGRGADVHRDGIMPERGIAGFNVDNMEPSRVAHDRGGHLSLSRAQRRGNFANAQEGIFDRLFSPGMLDGECEAVEVGQPVFKPRRFHLQQPLHRQGIEFPLLGEQLLPDEVGFVLGGEFSACQTRLLRHFHRQIVLENERRAGEDITLGDGRMRQHALAAGIHLAAGYPDDALAAGALAAARRFDLHASLPRGIQQRGLLSNPGRFPGGMKFNLRHRISKALWNIIGRFTMPVFTRINRRDEKDPKDVKDQWQHIESHRRVKTGIIV